MTPLIPIILITVALSGVYCDSHNLRFYYSVFLDKISNLPEAIVVRYLDDHEILDYNGGYHLVPPVNQQMEKNEEVDYHKRAHMFKGRHPICRHGIDTAMRHFNKSSGFQSFQFMAGCELRDDGTTSGYSQIGYDGKDFSYLDLKSAIWIPTMFEAQITTQEWNSPDVTWGEMQKNFLKNDCIEKLKNYIEYGRNDLEKRVRPEVKVLGRHRSDNMTRLQCLVYGFHPRPVNVKWVKNGTKHIPSHEMTPILPHPDGTYQIRVSVEVPTREGDTYSCHVEHSSLEEILIVNWDRTSVNENVS